MSAPLRVHALTRYGRLGASSRLRWLQFEPALRASGLQLQTQALLDDGYLQRKYAGRPVAPAVLHAYLRRAWQLLRATPATADVVWLEKELWPWAPAWLERWLLKRRPFVLDFDDAVFHNYDLHRSALVRRLYGRKIDRLMRAAALVVVGSPYLGERARAAGARRVAWLPTVVDHERYPVAAEALPPAADRPLRIGWIGSPTSIHYVQPLAAPLAALARQRPIELHLIGASIALPGVAVRSHPWSEAGEAAAIAALDVGVMPLPDTPWERGKCGYKLVQYMASGLPVVASAVGANPGIVAHGVDGFLASDDAGWLAALNALADDPALRARMGRCGRDKVRQRFSLAAAAPQLAGWLRECAARHGADVNP